MKRSQLAKMYLKILTEKSLKGYKKQKNMLADFIKKKKTFFNSLNPSIATYNWKFLKTVKSIFSYKASDENKITLAENWKIIDNNTDIAQELINNFSKNAVVSVNVQENEYMV